MNTVRVGLCLVLVLGLVSGCAKKGQAPAKVSGVVEYKNKPVPGGNIIFHSDMGNYRSSLSPDGTYEIVDLPVGEMVVTVETDSANPEKKAPAYSPQADKMYAERMAAERKAGSPVGPGGPPPVQYVKIPAKYSNAKTSTLTATLAAGRQVKNFTLTD